MEIINWIYQLIILDGGITIFFLLLIIALFLAIYFDSSNMEKWIVIFFLSILYFFVINFAFPITNDVEVREKNIENYFIIHGMDESSAKKVSIFDLSAKQLKKINEYYKKQDKARARTKQLKQKKEEKNLKNKIKEILGVK